MQDNKHFDFETDSRNYSLGAMAFAILLFLAGVFLGNPANAQFFPEHLEDMNCQDGTCSAVILPTDTEVAEKFRSNFLQAAKDDATMVRVALAVQKARSAAEEARNAFETAQAQTSRWEEALKTNPDNSEFQKNLDESILATYPLRRKAERAEGTVEFLEGQAKKHQETAIASYRTHYADVEDLFGELAWLRSENELLRQDIQTAMSEVSRLKMEADIDLSVLEDESSDRNDHVAELTAQVETMDSLLVTLCGRLKESIYKNDCSKFSPDEDPDQ